jgi:hypothetical protein
MVVFSLMVDVGTRHLGVFDKGGAGEHEVPETSALSMNLPHERPVSK